MELDAEFYLSGKADHSTFARNYAKIPKEYIKKLVKRLVELINKDFVFWIVDSTKLSTKIKVERTRTGLRCKEKLNDSYHVLIGYDPPPSTTVILDVEATDNHISDSRAAALMLKNKKSNAYILGDSAYNTYELHEIIHDIDLFPLIKPDKRYIKRRMSTKARNIKLFSKAIYAGIRGV